MSKPASYAWLAWRAAVPHPLRALRRTGTGEERFLAAYAGEGLAPTSPEDRAAAEAASACISCGLCEAGCALRGAIPSVRDLGLHAAFRLHGKSQEMIAHAAGPLAACAACTGCEPLCPTGVPITRLVRLLAARAAASDAPRQAPGAAGR
jgi:succinate dehydrogenase/fumarate reductase-like Fe-S protein